MFRKKRPKTHQKQSQLSTEEAFRLWEKTRLRYVVINHISLLGNFTHDVDFQLVLKNINKTLQEHAKMLEKELKKYSINSPEPSKKDIEAIGNTEVLVDKHTAQFILNDLQLIVSKCFLTIRDTVLNDAIRELLYKIAKQDIEMYHKYLNFITEKGWLQEPPLYKSLKNAEKRIATNEVWHLWELLDNRYLSKHKTKYYISNVIDKDFQILLETGINILEKQTTTLEKMLLTFGVNLPEQYAKSIATPETKERFSDEYIFKELLLSIIDAVTLEGVAVQELSINQEIREMIKAFIFEEMDVINNVIKYGKVKGWIPLVPQFRS
ncbi:MAG: DUF3231 family protein [Firmicutes bacterium]|nr:DUF3231 family protein [Bacillota bacterium]